jgi:Na+/H+ antiporter NhaC
MDSFGIVSIIPFAAAMFFLIWQEDIILPILGGLVLGGFMLSRFNPLLGLYTVGGELIFESLLNSRNITILAMTAAALILFALLNRFGYMLAFVKRIERWIDSGNKLEITILLSSLLIFIDRHLSSLLAGMFTKPLASRQRLSPLKHAYLLNTISSSVSTLIPITVLTPIILASIGTAFKAQGIEFSPMRALYLSLPYQFFNIFTLFTAVTLLVFKRDVLFMKRLTEAAGEDGRILSFGLQLNTKSTAESQVAFYGVVGSLVVLFATIAFVYSRDAITSSVQPQKGYEIIFVNGLFVSIIFALIYIFISRTLTYREWKSISGKMNPMLSHILIYMLLSFAIQVLARRLSLGTSLAGLLQQSSLYMRFIPMIIFVIACIVSLLSGSAPLTISILLPVALKIMGANMADPMLIDRQVYATIGAVLSGATFGDMSSPFSINYIISSAAAGAGIKQRFISQIGYSLIAFAAAILFGYLLFTINVKPYVSISAGFLGIALLLIFLTDRILGR